MVSERRGGLGARWSCCAAVGSPRLSFPLAVTERGAATPGNPTQDDIWRAVWQVSSMFKLTRDLSELDQLLEVVGIKHAKQLYRAGYQTLQKVVAAEPRC